jgi:hypothetical protein
LTWIGVYFGHVARVTPAAFGEPSRPPEQHDGGLRPVAATGQLSFLG